MDIQSYSGPQGRRLDTPRLFRSAFVATICVVMTTALKLATDSLPGPENPWLLYLVGVMVAAWYGGSDSGLMATPLSVIACLTTGLLWDGHSCVQTAGEGFNLALFLLEGMLVSHFVGSSRATRQDLEDVRMELAGAYDASIEAWGKILDLRDRETEGHSRRVVQLTLRLAGALGIDEESLIHMRRGALLHDIGKIGVPDRVLLKPGPLDASEWAIMKQHPMHAMTMLGSIEFLRPSMEIPFCHHEKWDGTGYPRGLKGEEIPLSARIFAIVDIWDALAHDRAYRRGWPPEKIYTHLESLVGTHLDPDIVPAFLSLMQGSMRDPATAGPDPSNPDAIEPLSGYEREPDPLKIEPVDRDLARDCPIAIDTPSI
ncbi:HD domain-containing phosphohydrolase [Singulisphaera rosea]